jgi:hypothetical protein
VPSPDPDLGGINLPGSPDLAIDHRLRAPPIGGGLGDGDEPLGLVGQDREGNPALPSTSIVGVKISRIPPTQKSPGRSTERRLSSILVAIDDIITPGKLDGAS